MIRLCHRAQKIESWVECIEVDMRLHESAGMKIEGAGGQIHIGGTRRGKI